MPIIPTREDEGPIQSTSIKLPPELLARVDEVAMRKGQSRNSVMELLLRWACAEAEREDSVPGSLAGIGPEKEDDEAELVVSPLRIGEKLLERVKAIGKQKGRSRNVQITWFVRWGLQVDEEETRAEEKARRKRK